MSRRTENVSCAKLVSITRTSRPAIQSVLFLQPPLAPAMSSLPLQVLINTSLGTIASQVTMTPHGGYNVGKSCNTVNECFMNLYLEEGLLN